MNHLCCQLKKEYLIATYKIFQEGEKGGVYSEFSQISACKSPFITEVTRKSYYLDQQYMILKKKVCPACRTFWKELKEAFEKIYDS